MSQNATQQAGVTVNEHPTCGFTGEFLMGTAENHYGGPGGIDSESIPIAAAEFIRRSDDDDESLPGGPGIAPKPLYRTTLPGRELLSARQLRGTNVSDFTVTDVADLWFLVQNGWEFKFYPTDPAPSCDEEWCFPYKPFDR